MTQMAHQARLLLSGVCILICLACSAQQDDIDPILTLFPEVFNNPAGYLNGRENTFVYPVATGTPFFMRSGESNASLVTHTGTYDSILLKYDLLNDILLLGFKAEEGIEEIQLNKNIVLSFNLFGSEFVNLSEPAILPEGYYEQLYNGNIRLYKKHIKILSGKSGPVQFEYRYNTQTILIHNHQAYRIFNKSSLLKALNDNQKKVSNYLKENHIMVNRATEDELIRVIKYYESLLPK